jgi:hypothetical protein
MEKGTYHTFTVALYYSFHVCCILSKISRRAMHLEQVQVIGNQWQPEAPARAAIDSQSPEPVPMKESACLLIWLRPKAALWLASSVLRFFGSFEN